ncbi:vesicular glutamate transporter 2-like isoform X2 [Zootermopsis nevadensis]|uniref:vesicular glutamate transporter 2-like isoform X2 n=1 Tax=Zootermopsis nevadensis TaxID=136037 RepID=UPI000B8E26BB|nr:vesicular glutamate transporter 2-like isoform X2 [Zootermopsis nevadensis]
MELSGPSRSPTEKTAIKSQLSFNQDLPEIPEGTSSKWHFSIPRRYVVAIMAFLGFCNVYSLRVNLSVAIVAMTSNYSYTENGTEQFKQDYPWSSEVQGLVLSSFFFGYIVTQIPGGWYATQIGGKKLFGIGVGVTALVSLLTPALASTNLYLLVLGRVVEGLFEGVTYPSIHAVWSHWAPPLERSRLATIAFSGSYFGTVISLPLSGMLAEYVGWPYIFYLFGILALIWCALWWYMVAETPQADRRITDAELEYIRSSIGPSANHIKNVEPPWKRFLTSLPVWAIMIAHFSENWGFYTLLTELPTFMKDVLKFDLKDAGLLAALPYLVMGVTVQSGGFLADWLRSQGNLTTTQVRKLCNCGAFVCQTLFLLAVAHSTTPSAVVASLTAAVGFGGFAWAGFSVNHLDIAPQFASILMGLSNTVATLPGIFSPLLTGHLVQDKTPEEWQAVFYIAGGVYLAGALFYGLFASGERQKWADIPDSYALCRDDQSYASTEDMPYGTGSCE